MDECDMAQAREDSEREYRIAEARRNAPVPTFVTHCQWCGDPTEGGAGYCTTDCRDDHQANINARERGGN